MRRSFVIAAAASVFALAGQAAAGPKPHDVSWGRAGVSYADYQRDRLDCANKTYGLDVSMKPETAQAVGALNNAALYDFVEGLAFATTTNGSYRDGEAGYRAALSVIEPDHAMFRNTTYTSLYRNAARTDVVDQLQAVLDYCLEQRGYRRFRLTVEQRHTLSTLKRGSEARSRYLYALGRDATVLTSQTD